MPFGVVLSFEYMHFLNIRLISLCLFLLLSSGKQSQWILPMFKKKLYMYNIKLVSVDELLFQYIFRLSSWGRVLPPQTPT